MIEDTFETLEDSDVEDEAQTEVNKILFEVTNGQLNNAKIVQVLLFLLSLRFKLIPSIFDIKQDYSVKEAKLAKYW